MANELSHPTTMERLMNEIEPLAQRFNATTGITAVDVAVEALLNHPAEAEQMHRYAALNKRRSFVYFQSKTESPPKFTHDLDACVGKFKRKVNRYFHEKRWGSETRIYRVDRADELQLTIGHGMPRQFLEAIVGNRFDYVDYRPVRDDLLCFNKLTGETKINAMTEAQRRMYRCTFGETFFDDVEMFPEGDIWTVEPLIQHGDRALSVVNVPELLSAELVKVKLDLDTEEPEVITSERKHLITALQQRMKLFCDDDGIARIIEAKIELHFADSRKRRMVTIKPPNIAQFNRDNDAAIVEAFLADRGFAGGSGHGPTMWPGPVLGGGPVGSPVTNV